MGRMTNRDIYLSTVFNDELALMFHWYASQFTTGCAYACPLRFSDECPYKNTLNQIKDDKKCRIAIEKWLGNEYGDKL